LQIRKFLDRAPHRGLIAGNRTQCFAKPTPFAQFVFILARRRTARRSSAGGREQVPINWIRGRAGLGRGGADRAGLNESMAPSVAAARRGHGAISVIVRLRSA
jgi:hypothetical protein